ncbi:hypothetical protein R1flu_010116 [Riccia fluitans]|uniref:Uncharacterized protein n=1 Tax=Riccia fluitans TaxID=41844 RepID=A0ABD1Z6L6_9MARC
MDRHVSRIRQMSSGDNWEKHLVRRGVKLYGTRWCTMCRKQKALLSEVCSSSKRFYVDCDALRNVLECSAVKKIPSWRVAGKWFIGEQTESSLEHCLQSTVQGLQRWDVAEFTRRHRRRGKWAKEAFADLVKRSILKARATTSAEASPPLVVHCPGAAGHVSESEKGWNHTGSFMAGSSARDLIIFVLAAATISQEKLYKFLQAVTSSSKPLNLSGSFLSQSSTRMASHKQTEQKVAFTDRELGTSTLMECKNECRPGLDLHKGWNYFVGTFSGIGGKPRVTAGQQRIEKVGREENWNEVHRWDAAMGEGEETLRMLLEARVTVASSWIQMFRHLTKIASSNHSDAQHACYDFCYGC